MAEESAAFMATCQNLEELSGLPRIQARGTVRLAIQEAGLFDNRVTAAEMIVVVKSVLARELEDSGLADAEALCERLAERLAAVVDDVADDSPEEVFARLGVA